MDRLWRLSVTLLPLALSHGGYESVRMMALDMFRNTLNLLDLFAWDPLTLTSRENRRHRIPVPPCGALKR